jgi:hypothetical protein
MEDQTLYLESSEAAARYVRDSKGATAAIINYIQENTVLD